MKNVTVRKAQLLETLGKNMATHEADFEIAWEAFREKAIHNFEERLRQLKDLKKGESIQLYVNMTVPENHVEDYQRALRMLDWELGDEIVLTEREFSELVLDDWGWKAAFASTNELYAGSASPSTVR